MAKTRLKGVLNHTQFMKTYFPKEYERRVKEGRCIHCGAKKPESPFSSAFRREQQS